MAGRHGVGLDLGVVPDFANEQESPAYAASTPLRVLWALRTCGAPVCPNPIRTGMGRGAGNGRGQEASWWLLGRVRNPFSRDLPPYTQNAAAGGSAPQMAAAVELPIQGSVPLLFHLT